MTERDKEALERELSITRGMTQDERSHRAVDWMTKGLMTDAEKAGKPISEDTARSKAAEIARRADHKRK